MPSSKKSTKGKIQKPKPESHNRRVLSRMKRGPLPPAGSTPSYGSQSSHQGSYSKPPRYNGPGGHGAGTPNPGGMGPYSTFGTPGSGPYGATYGPPPSPRPQPRPSGYGSANPGSYGLPGVGSNSKQPRSSGYGSANPGSYGRTSGKSSSGVSSNEWEPAIQIRQRPKPSAHATQTNPHVINGFFGTGMTPSTMGGVLQQQGRNLMQNPRTFSDFSTAQNLQTAAGAMGYSSSKSSKSSSKSSPKSKSSSKKPRQSRH